MRVSLLSALFICITIFSALRADVVELRNGDRISGELKSLESGKVTLETDYAGDVIIDFSKVSVLESVDPMILEFESGQKSEAAFTISGETVEVRAENPFSVTRAQLVRIDPRPEPLQDLSLVENWHGSADLGYAITRGNSDTSNLSLTVTPVRRTLKDRIRTRFQTLYSVQDDITTTDLYRAEGRYDRFIGPDTFLFILGEAERDGQQLLDLRTREGGGVGFELEPRSDLAMSVFGGVTFLQENYEGQDLEYNAEGLAGFELETTILSPAIINARSQFLPLLTEDRFLFEFNTGLRVPVFSGLTIGIEFFDNYDSEPPAGVKNNDLGLLSTLGYTF